MGKGVFGEDGGGFGTEQFGDGNSSSVDSFYLFAVTLSGQRGDVAAVKAFPMFIEPAQVG